MAIKFLNTVAVDTSVLYVNAANNRVGINTISPDNTLSVGDGTVDESLAVYHSDGTFTRINGYGLYMSRTASYIRPTSGNSQTLSIGNVTKPWSGVVYNANTHYFRSGANENMRITSTGNVGIGTTSPGSPLEINGVGTGSGVGEGIRVTREGVNGQYISIDEADGSRHRIRAIGDKPFDIFSSASSYGINLHTNSLQRMTITNTGDVGIGTTSPQAKLNIDGSVKIEGENALWFGGSGSVPAWQINASGSDLVIDDIGGNSGDFIFSGQNIGIGTTNPNAKLHVVNGSSGQTYSNVSGALIDVNGTSNSYSALRVGSSAGNNHLVVTNAGKVGIGATSPNEKLSVDTGSNGSAGYISVDSQTLTRLKLGYSFTSSPSAITAAQIYADSSGNLDISSRGNAASAIQLYTSSGTSPSERMRIASDGKVGIGTTSPSDTLEVEGGVTITSETPTKLLLNNTKNGTWTAGEALGLVEFYCNDASGGGAKVQSSIEVVAQDQYGAHFNMLFKLSKGSTGNLEVMKLTGEGDLYMTDGTVTATNFITSSDERLKENIKEAFGDKVEVNWKTFELKTDKGHKRYGVIAQDLEKNHPEFVKTDNEGMKSVAYTDLLIAKIAELENRIQTLENK